MKLNSDRLNRKKNLSDFKMNFYQKEDLKNKINSSSTRINFYKKHKSSKKRLTQINFYKNKENKKKNYSNFILTEYSNQNKKRERKVNYTNINLFGNSKIKINKKNELKRNLSNINFYRNPKNKKRNLSNNNSENFCTNVELKPNINFSNFDFSKCDDSYVNNNNLDIGLKKDLKNIDIWIFHNFENKLTEEKFEGRIKIENMLDFDIEIIDKLIKNSTSKKKEAYLKMKNEKKINYFNNFTDQFINTSNYQNNINNKKILISIVEKKLKNFEVDIKFPKKVFILSKMIVSNLVANFTVLKNFNDKKIIEMKNLIIDIKNTMKEDFLNYLEKVENKKPLFNEYEKILKTHLKKITSLINKKNEEFLKVNQSIKVLNNLILEKKEILKEIKKQFSEKNHKNSLNFDKNTNNLKSFLNYKKLKSEQVFIENRIFEIISKSKNDIRWKKIKIMKIKNRIKEYKFKKKWILIKLKEFFFDLLLDEKNILNYGKNLLYIVRKIYEMKENVNFENFSKFFKKEDIFFVKEYTKLLLDGKKKTKNNIFFLDNFKQRVENDKKFNKEKKNILFLENYKKKILENHKKNFFKNDQIEKIIKIKQILKKFKTYRNNQSDLKSKTKIKKLKIENIKSLQNFKISKYNLSPKTLKTFLINKEKKTKLKNLENDYIDIVIKRIINTNSKNPILGHKIILYLEKLFLIIFGERKKKILLNEIRKSKKIYFIPLI